MQRDTPPTGSVAGAVDSDVQKVPVCEAWRAPSWHEVGLIAFPRDVLHSKDLVTDTAMALAGIAFVGRHKKKRLPHLSWLANGGFVSTFPLSAQYLLICS